MLCGCAFLCTFEGICKTPDLYPGVLRSKVPQIAGDGTIRDFCSSFHKLRTRLIHLVKKFCFLVTNPTKYVSPTFPFHGFHLDRSYATERRQETYDRRQARDKITTQQSANMTSCRGASHRELCQAKLLEPTSITLLPEK